MMHPLNIIPSLAIIAFIMLCMNSLVMEGRDTNTIPRNEMDRLALLHFKNGITGDPLGGLRSWNNTLHFCDWNGVLCDRQHQRVSNLNLSSLRLTGSISPHITNLTALVELDLAHNIFRGPLPHDIGRLSSLQHLDLLDNYVSGEIPTSLSKCKELNFLRFRFNEFTGSIPSELSFLSKLQVLDLYSNNITGSIPPSLGNLSSLVVLSMALNGMGGSFPGDVGRIPSLQILNFYGNQISGTIPSALLNITSLSYFTFAENRLHGNLPGEVGTAFPNLKQFAGGLNNFAGPIPVSLSNASQLEVLDFPYNELSGTVPISFGALQNLVRLNFGGDNHLETDNIDGMSFITSLTNCTSLEVFALDNNRLTGTLPDSIANLSSHLNILSLGTNQLSGRFPAGLEKYVNLSVLNMEYNFFTGHLPVSLGRLRLLQEIFLHGNGLSGQIPSSLGNLTQLSILQLAGNDFSGNIPPTLSSCQHLQQLDLSHNKLDGMIPGGIMSVSSLSISLDFSMNVLTGSLSDEVQNLQSLENLDLSGNKLSGKIPAALGKCVGLERLKLGGNLLEGTIPLSLSMLAGIQELDLSCNNLSGPIPEFLGKLSSLQNLNLSFNSLEGAVPNTGVFGNASAFSVVGNYELCGGMTSLHLPSCSTHTSGTHRSHAAMKIAIAVAIAALLLLVLVACYFVAHYLTEKSKKERLSSVPSLEIGPAQVSYAELLRATCGFSSSKLIGEGSCGSVYRGEHICNEEIVAVKVLRTQMEELSAPQIFTYECESLRNIRHRNLVKIITSCSSTDFRGNDFKAMVYEYMPNGNLDSWLHPVHQTDGQHKLRKLTFIEGLNVAVDVACALEYLHHHCYQCIVHCNLKPSNVLLDDDMIAHVGDFGLARFLPEVVNSDCCQDEIISSRVKGSPGYLAPEYGTGSPAATRGDVYGYGILLLEIFTGRRPTDPMFTDGLTLHSFAKSAFPEGVAEIIDPALVVQEGKEGGGDAQALLECVASVIGIGISCSDETPGERMDMGQVSAELRAARDAFVRVGVGVRGLGRNAAEIRR